MPGTSRVVAPLFFVLTIVFSSPLGWSANNQALDGQIVMLARDIRSTMEKDRLLKGQRLRLEGLTSIDIPMANFDQYVEQALRKELGSLIDQTAALSLKIECSYLVSQSKTNQDKRVLQIVAKILERGQPVVVKINESETELKPILREVNNSSDIGRFVGLTYTPPDTADYDTRLRATEAAFSKPSFHLINGTRVAAHGKHQYAVEVFTKHGPSGQAKPIAVANVEGLAYAPIQIGDTYQIALYNYSATSDAVAKIEVDGLDVATTFCIDKDAAGETISNSYVVPRSVAGNPGRHHVPGWLYTTAKGERNVFEFVVNELGKGAASALKSKGNVGVITVRFYEAWPPDARPSPRSFGETGVGQARQVDYQKVKLQFSNEPDAIVSIRYNKPQSDKNN